MDHVTREAVFESRVLVPGWYSRVEAKLKEMSKTTSAPGPKKRFSIGREEFESLCDSCLPPSSRATSTDPRSESAQRIQTILEMFHHWGVVFALPSSPSSATKSHTSGEQESTPW
jgi:hypothetical protein